MSDDFRWRSWFQRSAEPLFVLNRSRRVAFVNRAWEELTGLPLKRARQLNCRRRRRPAEADWEALLEHILRPPDEVLQGKPSGTQHAVPRLGPDRGWWEIAFLPFRDADGLLFVIGRISTERGCEAVPAAVVPEAVVALRETVLRRYTLDALAGEGPAMRRVAEQVRLAARVAVPVLLVGERGTGKQWVARTIHAAGSERSRPFVALDCARLPPAAVAGVLCGEGELAQRIGAGTVYLREPSQLPHELQLRLCRLLEGRKQREPTDAALPRLLAGCRADPTEEVRSGKLLEELYCRLSTLVVRLPPLRERLSDLPFLVERLLERTGAAAGRRAAGLTLAAWHVLRAYAWPGNVAELYEVLVAASARVESGQIDAPDLPLYLRLGARPAQADRALPLKPLLEEAERRLIVLALRRAGGNKSRAAEILAVSRALLLRRIRDLGIEAASKEEG